jgi:SAM-dependent methyltransferase
LSRKTERGKDALTLDRVAFLGRTYREYLDMFGLGEGLLREGPVLDCPAGPSSFAAEGAGKGLDVVACDALYGHAGEELHKRGLDDIAHVFERFDRVAHLYLWKYYTDREEVVSLRTRALESFVRDFEKGKPEGRYVEASLPWLPFADGSFPLVLSANFLFLYGDRVDFGFHMASLRELLRVCSGEVRVFPLAGLDARPYPRLDEIVRALKAGGALVETVGVPFEFQRGANMMLKLRRRG